MARPKGKKIGRPKGTSIFEKKIQLAVGVDKKTKRIIEDNSKNGQSEWIREAILQRIEREKLS